MPSPLAIVNEKFGSKDKLVDQIVGLLSKESDEPKEELRKRLLSVANKKLLHLHDVASTVQDKFGSHEKLVEAAAGALGKAKDKDFVTKLGTQSDARLLDIEKAARRRSAAASKA